MMINLYRIDPQGATHYYSLHDRQGHLFSPHCFTVSWGRNLSLSREKTYQYDSQKDMDDGIRKLVLKKFRAGYRVLYSYLRPDEMEDLRPELGRFAAR